MWLYQSGKCMEGHFEPSRSMFQRVKKKPKGTHPAVTCCFVLGAVPFAPIAGAGLHKAASGEEKHRPRARFVWW